MGLTDCVPPVAAKVYELPSLPVMVTLVEFFAVTVRVVELPTVMVDSLAVKVTTGAVAGLTVTVAVAEIFPPAPIAVAV